MNQELPVTATPRPLVAGNWKMNGTRASLSELSAMCRAAEEGDGFGAELLLCPPATLIAGAVERAGRTLAIGAQDCHAKSCGAHTGDISAEMIADAGATYVIVGHSERRQDYAETDDAVRAKAEAAWDAGLCAIVCIGETGAERDSGQALDVVGRQLQGSVPDGATAERLVVAYEPVWAIGSGVTPTCEDVAVVHGAIREALTTRFGEEGAGVRILYGGSVKPTNAHELMKVANVNGALVGGASLKATDFLAIAAAIG
jgi:triosephosphate isomerase